MSAPFQSIPIMHLDLTSPRGRQCLQDALDQLVAMFSGGRIDTKHLTPAVQAAIQTAAVITDWEAATVVASWTTNTTTTARKKRIADMLYLQVHMAFSGAPGPGSTLQITIPDGLVVDDEFALIGAVPKIGEGNLRDISGTNSEYIVQALWLADAALWLSDRVGIYCADTDGAAAGIPAIGAAEAVTATFPFTIAAGDSISFEIRVPIVGWRSSSTQ
jgi:hypothetical protein